MQQLLREYQIFLTYNEHSTETIFFSLPPFIISLILLVSKVHTSHITVNCYALLHERKNYNKLRTLVISHLSTETHEFVLTWYMILKVIFLWSTELKILSLSVYLLNGGLCETFAFRTDRRLPSGASSRATRRLGRTHTPYRATMHGWRSLLRMATSCRSSENALHI